MTLCSGTKAVTAGSGPGRHQGNNRGMDYVNFLAYGRANLRGFQLNLNCTEERWRGNILGSWSYWRWRSSQGMLSPRVTKWLEPLAGRSSPARRRAAVPSISAVG